MAKIILEKKSVNYTVRKNKRAKRLSLTVYPNKLVVTVPFGLLSNYRIERVLKQKRIWILKKMEWFEKNQGKRLIKNTRANYLKYKEQARSLVNDRISCYNQLYKFKFNKLAIKNQKTRWGSCSKQKNLNFNYRLIFLPTSLVDYVIVHELCHLAELNHSKKFWHLVEQTIPDFKQCCKKLKKYNLSLD
ncbi:MAG: SprT family zinc-dependent metalloprotease [bacterium]